MAKKKLRYRKSKHIYHPPKTPLDMHHIFFIGRKWGCGYLCQLRQYWYCKIYIPRDSLHRYIHENLANIPTPRPQSAKDALDQLKYLEKYGAIHDADCLEKRLELLIALFECSEQRTADALKQQLAIVHEFYEKPS